jgi:ABC-2 type transport system ATP-binding protein
VSAIAVDHLTKTYSGGSMPAVDGVSLIVEPGQVFGLLGPNGAGKSTIVGACTTRVVPTSGSVRIDEIDVASDPIAAKRRLGVVAQHNTLDRSVSVWENLYLHCRYFGMTAGAARARSDELLETFGLSDRRGSLVPTLSGGQARRLQLARGLAHRPSVIFLDEPTVGLDPQSRQLLWTLVRELRDQHVAILLTTHDMDEADRLCDRLAVIDHGRVIAEGSPADLKAGLGAETTITVTVAANPAELQSELSDLPDVSSVSAGTNGELRVLANGGDQTTARVVQSAVRYGLLGLSVEPVSLETVFITLTGRQLRD